MIPVKDNPVRALLAECAIGLAVCAGAYALLVDPAQRELLNLQSKIADLRTKSQTASSIRISPAQLEAARTSARQFAQSVAVRSLPARDETSMFKSLSDLATRHRVRIDDLRPAQVKHRGAADPNRPAPPKGDAQVAYGFTLVGDFSDATAFLADVEEQLGYSIVRNVRMQPVEDPGTRLVRLAVETEYRAFDTGTLAAAGNEHGSGGDR